MTQITPLKTIQESISSELEGLNSLIASSLMSDNQLMNKIVNGYLQAKGKQIRPILVILAAKMLGDMNDRVLHAAAAVEMLHNASLIHDDVVDQSKIRHSRPTINSVWDNHLAVLVGDFFVSNALDRALATGDIKIVSSIANLGKQLSLGEIDQIYNARFHSITEEAYFGIISRKTASLFVSCVEMGGYSVGVDDDRLDAMRRYANLLGLCFQIRDDIFDYFEASKVGKPTGNDLREGKITLPLIYALSQVSHPCHDEMSELAAREELDTTDIDRLISFAKDAGGIEYSLTCMGRLRDEAVEALSSIEDPHCIKPMFVDLIDFIVSRQM